MAMVAACPVSYETVDHTVSRVTCILTILGLTGIAALAVMSGTFRAVAWAFAAALTLDYAIRAWTKLASPMQRLARGLARAFGLAEKPTDAAPKRFACRIGFFFALGIVALLPVAAEGALVVAGILLFFNVLDGVCDYCVGCKMYALLFLSRNTSS